MIRINLLPYRKARKTRDTQRLMGIYLMTVLGCLGLLALLYFFSTSYLRGLDKKVANKKQEVSKYDKINKEINQIKKNLEILKKKTKVIENLEGDRLSPVKLLDTMTETVIEKRLWFGSYEDKGDRLMISGYAVDNKTVADFMTRLEDSKQFASVRLDDLIQSNVKDTQVKNFKITCIKSDPQKTKPQEGTEKK